MVRNNLDLSSVRVACLQYARFRIDSETPILPGNFVMLAEISHVCFSKPFRLRRPSYSGVQLRNIMMIMNEINILSFVCWVLFLFVLLLLCFYLSMHLTHFKINSMPNIGVIHFIIKNKIKNTKNSHKQTNKQRNKKKKKLTQQTPIIAH